MKDYFKSPGEIIGNVKDLYITKPGTKAREVEVELDRTIRGIQENYKSIITAIIEDELEVKEALIKYLGGEL